MKQSPLKVFFDADVIISASFLQSGASFILLQLSELGFIKGYISKQVLEESQRNIQNKLPSALPVFKEILNTSKLKIISPTEDEIKSVFSNAHKKDVPILAAALHSQAEHLTTFNIKDFYPSSDHNIKIAKPSEITKIIGKG
ncbi:MAG: PIN domain-containing protein [Candidatus Marinimicrobia bacterium]|nr:PIN domain-containing protein [Candidatus Neomarinimicrobiota bacterium]